MSTPQAEGAGGGEERPTRTARITLLESKRSTAVGIAQNKIRLVLGGKELRDAIAEVDENVLTLDTLKMVRSSAAVQ